MIVSRAPHRKSSTPFSLCFVFIIRHIAQKFDRHAPVTMHLFYHQSEEIAIGKTYGGDDLNGFSINILTTGCCVIFSAF